MRGWRTRTVLILLTGCGSGGGGTTPDAPPPPPDAAQPPDVAIPDASPPDAEPADAGCIGARNFGPTGCECPPVDIVPLPFMPLIEQMDTTTVPPDVLGIGAFSDADMF